MKKIIGLIAVMFLFVGCTNGIEEESITLEEVIQVFEQNMGIEIDRDRKPIYSMIGAIDGILFNYGRFPVKLYVYESIQSYERAIETFPAMADWERIGIIVLETSNAKAREIFHSIGNTNNNPIIFSDSLENMEDETVSTNVEEIEEDTQIEEQQDYIIDYYVVGETALIADWEIAFNSFEFSDTGVDTMFITSVVPSLRADEGNKIVRIHAEFMNFANTSRSPKSSGFFPSSSEYDLKATLLYDGYFEYTIFEAIPLDYNSISFIAPLMSRDMVLQAEVPNIVVESNNSLELLLEKGAEKIVFKLR